MIAASFNPTPQDLSSLFAVTLVLALVLVFVPVVVAVVLDIAFFGAVVVIVDDVVTFR